MKRLIEGPEYHSAHIGGGPGGQGVFIAGDREGHVQELVGRGAILLDAGNVKDLGRGGLGKPLIKSNSEGVDFTTAVGRRGIYRTVLNGTWGRILRKETRNAVPLAGMAAPFLGELGARTAQELQEDTNPSGVRTRIHIARIDQRDDDQGVYSVLTSKSGIKIAARNVVLATGAVEEPMYENVILSSQLINGEALDQVGSMLEGGERVAFIGASHSTFSAVDLLKTKYMFSHEGAITVVSRGPLRRYFESEDAARASNYQFSPEDVCVQTGKVHRYGGIRGSAGRWADTAAAGSDRSVQLLRVTNLHEAEDILERAEAVIQATGYKARTIPIFEGKEQIGPAVDDRGQVVVGTDARVQGSDGRVLPNIFGIGIGHGLLPTPDLGGERSFTGRIDSVNMFHGPVGKLIVEGILNTQ